MASIEDLVRQNPRERIFVQPSEWKDRHVELLEVAFVINRDNDKDQDRPVNIVDQAAPADGKGPVDPRPIDDWTHEAERLATSNNKNQYIRHLLAGQKDPKGPKAPFRCESNYGQFHYGHTHTFRLHGMTFAPASRDASRDGQANPRRKHQPVVFAFMQRIMIKIQRELVYPVPGPRRRAQSNNVPVAEMRQLQLKHLDPADHNRDPYILAVLIGLAQEQAWLVHDTSNGEDDATAKPENAAAIRAEENRDREYKVCAVLVDENNTEFINFYSATMSASFLSKFNYPRALAETMATPPSNLAIHGSKFPYQPYETFRQRLIDAIMAHHQPI
ncbi:hypothetical protein B0T10DRAFT_495781 [Thelonectria olida]|uniref:Uncharacterized protein n=1 Tax=Thelonectria olida TaxID=1576542 RepID=A0A9P8VVL7_9HYPO|nr:hypothetical protein B0T10DRAFT_495781 [Thelonectria olida]